MLKPLLLLVICWKDILIDFINLLPLSNRFDMIIIIVDRLTKIRYYSVYYIKITTP
jgi:hypothetical protein